MMRRALGLWVFASASLTVGCIPPWMLFDDDDPPPTIDDDPPPPAFEDVEEDDAGVPPTVQVSIPDFPPLGPGGEIDVSVSGPRALTRLDADFREHAEYSLDGTFTTLSIPAEDLGEGFGQLVLTAWDERGAWAERFVEDLLVDFSPPEIFLGTTVLPAEGASFEAWAADDWVLGRFELEAGAVVLSDAMEPGYPDSLGEAWHESLVKFPTEDLPEGTTLATFRAIDAAGNVAEEQFELTIDGHPPACSINAPASLAVVSGPFVVDLSGIDEGGGPVWLELYVSGSPVATAVGPLASVELDASELAPGMHVLSALAVDQAGNESELVEVPILVP